MNLKKKKKKVLSCSPTTLCSVSFIDYIDVTFIISSSEGSPEGASSSCLPVWDLLQVDEGIGQRLSVHIEHLKSVSVFSRPAQHQSQLKQEDVQPLTDETDTEREMLLLRECLPQNIIRHSQNKL